jgi:hypothetical protein
MESSTHFTGATLMGIFADIGTVISSLTSVIVTTATTTEQLVKLAETEINYLEELQTQRLEESRKEHQESLKQLGITVN